MNPEVSDAAQGCAPPQVVHRGVLRSLARTHLRPGSPPDQPASGFSGIHASLTLCAGQAFVMLVTPSGRTLALPCLIHPTT